MRHPRTARLPVVLAAFALAACQQPTGESAAPAPSAPPAQPSGAQAGTAQAPDGVPIAWTMRGSGDTAVVFVHCWSCDQAFWREQTGALDGYRRVTLDLGGHGDSGGSRERWTVKGLAGDVVAVADHLGLERMILVGHSMGGPVSLEAARLMPDRVVGIIAADTLHDADYEYPPEMIEGMLAGFEADYDGTLRNMFEGMRGEELDPELADWIVDKALTARREVAVALIRDYASLDLPQMFAEAGVPIRAINAMPAAGAPPTDLEGNRRLADFDAVIMEDVGHFLQLEAPAAFNEHLRVRVAELDAAG